MTQRCSRVNRPIWIKIHWRHCFWSLRTVPRRLPILRIWRQRSGITLQRHSRLMLKNDRMRRSYCNIRSLPWLSRCARSLRWSRLHAKLLRTRDRFSRPISLFRSHFAAIITHPYFYYTPVLLYTYLRIYSRLFFDSRATLAIFFVIHTMNPYDVCCARLAAMYLDFRASYKTSNRLHRDMRLPWGTHMSLCSKPTIHLAPEVPPPRGLFSLPVASRFALTTLWTS